MYPSQPKPFLRLPAIFQTRFSLNQTDWRCHTLCLSLCLSLQSWKNKKKKKKWHQHPNLHTLSTTTFKPFSPLQKCMYHCFIYTTIPYLLLGVSHIKSKQPIGSLRKKYWKWSEVIYQNDGVWSSCLQFLWWASWSQCQWGIVCGLPWMQFLHLQGLCWLGD